MVSHNDNDVNVLDEVKIRIPFDSSKMNCGTMKNIKKAIELIHDFVWEPSEFLNFDEILGERNAINWSYGESIIKGCKTQDIAGGIGYVATALFQLALKTSSISIIEAHNHSSKTWYADLGMDVTIYKDDIKGINKNLVLYNKSGCKLRFTFILKNDNYLVYLIPEDQRALKSTKFLSLPEIQEPNVLILVDKDTTKPEIAEIGVIGGKCTLYKDYKKIGNERSYNPKPTIIKVPAHSNIEIKMNDKNILA